ncbi:hypothetical protein H696_02413 [Fonticula alba]|uniref:DNA topoisomerase I n=1 Tax=Fonticula alba TaxID=691883 RepID=A0A058ZDF6_FONAL|nr:hypothetical protein H696_02413 [Fonticula alba]KCV71467.1 hypothetical protein H696_02413 [Fonticula alba]|eukprot:XP_009494590.1 hypothetical protein H696_02413 [Fonticula alba]
MSDHSDLDSADEYPSKRPRLSLGDPRQAPAQLAGLRGLLGGLRPSVDPAPGSSAPPIVFLSGASPMPPTQTPPSGPSARDLLSLAAAASTTDVPAGSPLLMTTGSNAPITALGPSFQGLSARTPASSTGLGNALAGRLPFSLGRTSASPTVATSSSPPVPGVGIGAFGRAPPAAMARLAPLSLSSMAPTTPSASMAAEGGDRGKGTSPLLGSTPGSDSQSGVSPLMPAILPAPSPSTPGSIHSSPLATPPPGVLLPSPGEPIPPAGALPPTPTDPAVLPATGMVAIKSEFPASGGSADGLLSGNLTDLGMDVLPLAQVLSLSGRSLLEPGIPSTGPASAAKIKSLPTSLAEATVLSPSVATADGPSSMRPGLGASLAARTPDTSSPLSAPSPGPAGLSPGLGASIPSPGPGRSSVSPSPMATSAAAAAALCTTPSGTSGDSSLLADGVTPDFPPPPVQRLRTGGRAASSSPATMFTPGTLSPRSSPAVFPVDFCPAGPACKLLLAVGTPTSRRTPKPRKSRAKEFVWPPTKPPPPPPPRAKDAPKSRLLIRNEVTGEEVIAHGIGNKYFRATDVDADPEGVVYKSDIAPLRPNSPAGSLPPSPGFACLASSSSSSSSSASPSPCSSSPSPSPSPASSPCPAGGESPAASPSQMLSPASAGAGTPNTGSGMGPGPGADSAKTPGTPESLAEDLCPHVVGIERRWDTLEHNGVVFPPAYIPHNVPLIYDGQPISLDPMVEEVATFFALELNTEYGQSEVFQRNFFRDFLTVLRDSEEVLQRKYPISQFDLCDFSRIHQHVMAERQARATRSPEDRARERERRDVEAETYGWCLLNGQREPVGNFRIEAPGLFKGRGNHPRTGTLKRRIYPEQVIINISEGVPVPPPPVGHRWGKVIHNPNVSWLAAWTENMTGTLKYVWLAQKSSVRGRNDLTKYDFARGLGAHIDRIRKSYTRELRASDYSKRQRSTALYFIDRLALRVGAEKDTEEQADTVGCCSLRLEHVTLRAPATVVLDFLGKDSMRYFNEVTVTPRVFQNLQEFMTTPTKKGPKGPGDLLFETLTPAIINTKLSTYLPGLTAKVFRTFNATTTFERELEKNTQELLSQSRASRREPTVAELVLAYSQANREAAILCNHQRTVPKAMDLALQRQVDQLLVLRYRRRRLRLLAYEQVGVRARIDKYLQRPEEDFTDADVPRAEALLREEAQRRENTPSKETPSPAPAEPGTEEDLGAIGLPGPEATLEDFVKVAIPLNQKIERIRLDVATKMEGRHASLSTSKANYLDPRVTVAWSLRHGVPLDKVFPKTVRERFAWATDRPDREFKF